MEPEKGAPLSDHELSDMLRRAAVRPSAAASAMAVRLSREVRDEVAGAVPIRRRRRRPGRVVAGAAVAMVALSGAGTIAAYQASVPPFQTLEEGVSRATSGIPVNYENSLGRAVECLAFIEYRNLTSDQEQAIEDASDETRWSGYGQRVLDDLKLPEASPEEQNNAIAEVMSDDLWEAAREAVPGIVRKRDSAGPVFAGYALSCSNPGGVDGQP